MGGEVRLRISRAEIEIVIASLRASICLCPQIRKWRAHDFRSPLGDSESRWLSPRPVEWRISDHAGPRPRSQAALPLLGDRDAPPAPRTRSRPRQPGCGAEPFRSPTRRAPYLRLRIPEPGLKP